jgi:hypothetical protein
VNRTVQLSPLRVTVWVLVLGASTFMAVLGVMGLLVKAGMVG